MTVAIVTDSNTSLPNSIIVDLPIFVAPLEVHINQKTYLDGVDIKASEFYRIIASDYYSLATSAPTPHAFLNKFRSANLLADEIICITLSSQLSATYTSAQQAVELFNEETHSAVKIQLIDSNTAGLAEGLMVLNCGYWAQLGYNINQISEYITRTKNSYSMIGCLNSLDYLTKSGRIPHVFKWLASTINIKPVIQFSAGDIKTVSRKRGIIRAIDEMVAIATQSIGDNFAFGAIMHSNEEKLANTLLTQLQEKINFRSIFVTELTPVIGAHVGNGLVGCAFYPIPNQ